MFESLIFPKKIEFKPEEIKTIRTLAQLRSKHKANWSLEDTYWNKTPGHTNEEKSFQSHYLGMCGEYGVSMMVNGRFDFIPRFLGDHDQADVLIGPSGQYRIAVKTTRYNPPIFKLTKLKEIEDATHLASCHYKEPVLTIQWIVSKTYFLSNMYVDSFGYGNRYCME